MEIAAAVIYKGGASDDSQYIVCHSSIGTKYTTGTTNMIFASIGKLYELISYNL